uniref:Cytochrome c oxidase subunit 2 n=1 Tax=Melosira undulata TaxID=2133757 RepID=A0A3G1PWD4_9STRA|nr:cytochrome c oxidase subunit II [Melosira undulata]AVR57552.1 cytochrome c oxidase subunit II [Melosira undulata]
MLINFLNNIFFIVLSLFIFILQKNSNCDASYSNQLDFQEAATPIMEGIIYFNHILSFIICFIVIFVGWFLLNVIYYFTENKNSIAFKFAHSNELEIIWTSIPAIILLFLATPSFSLLYSMDEIADPTMTLKIIGHQWYWSYEFSDYNYFFCNNITTTQLKYDSYIINLENMPKKQGYFRLLETNKRILLPIKTHIRLLVSSADVLHSWTIPSFGLKIDACPGRLNQVNLFIKRTGLFFGQCSEICGIQHAFMPITVVGIEQQVYSMFLYEQMIKFIK